MSEKPSSAEQEYHRRQDLVVMDDEDALRKEYRDNAARKIAEFQERFITPLVELRTLPTDCLIFANGFGHLISCFCQQELVKRHGGSGSAKANVSKYVKKYSRSIGLPAIQGQRNANAANNMRQARKKQLKPK